MKTTKKTKLLIPTIPLSLIAMSTPLMVACNKGDIEIIPTITVQHGTAQCTKIWMNNEFRVSYTPANGYKLGTVTIKIGNKTLVQGAEDGYTIEGNVIIVKAKAVTSDKIDIKITSVAIQAEKLWSFTEPSKDADRTATSKVIGDFQYKDGSKIKYSFAFPGKFTTTQDLTGHTIKASATFTYNADQNNLASTAHVVEWKPWNMDAVVTIGDDKHSFTMVFEKTYNYVNKENQIWDVPGNTEIELSSFNIIDNNGTEDSEPVTCSLAYKPTIIPNLVFKEGGQEILIDSNGTMSQASPIYYVNPDSKWTGNCYGHFSAKAGTGIEVEDKRFNVTNNSSEGYLSFQNEYEYSNFKTETLTTEAKEVGLEFYDSASGGNIWIKKEIGVGEPLKVKKTS